MSEIAVLDPGPGPYSVGGLRVPSVTAILVELGISEYHDGPYSDFYKVRGQAIHAAVAFHLEGALVAESVDPRVQPYLRAAIRFVEESGMAEHLASGEIEVRGYSPVHRFAGRPDYRGLAYGQHAVVDWKSGSVQDAVGLQLALYDLLPPTLLGAQQRRRFAVELRDDGTFKKRDYADRRDYARALAAVDLYRKFHLPRKQKKGWSL